MFALHQRFDTFVDEFELLGFVVAGRDVPVEIVHRENVHNGVVGNERYFPGIECAQEHRRQIFVESPRFSDGQDELREHGIKIEVATLGFGP